MCGVVDRLAALVNYLLLLVAHRVCLAVAVSITDFANLTVSLLLHDG